MAAPSRARKKHAKRSPNILATNRQDVQALRDWLLPALCAKNYGHGKTAKYRKFARR